LAWAWPGRGWSCRVRGAQRKAPGGLQDLRGQGVLGEAQVDAALREIRLALLEADVHFRVTKELVERVRARAMGQEVLKSLTPDQAVLRVVRDEMVEVLGGAEPRRSRLRRSCRA
jgi:signal recognition particle subunit SRP54